MSALTAKGLTKSYRGRRVVNGVDLHVRPNEIVGLLGPNGAGKTTCFYIITGLLQPDYGWITLDGHDITDLPMYRRSRLGIGYLPQEASIFRGLTVEQNIRAVLELLEPDRSRREARLDELLAEFSITHLRRTPAMALSGGERRRAEIARSLLSSPRYMLFDEPFAGVDPINVQELQKEIARLKSKGLGVLLTDHTVRDTLKICDRAYILADGKILEEGTPAQIAASERARSVYLGQGFTLS